MEFRDYYQILGLERDTTQDDIKRAYRKQARKYHPDVSKESDAETRFKEVTEAYEVLKDPEKRAAYDQLGSNWHNGQDFRPPPNWDAGFEFSGGGFTAGDASHFSDFFESLFGRANAGGFQRGGYEAGGFSGRGFHARGEDHHAKVIVEPEDAFQGTERMISLRRPKTTANGQVTTAEHTLKVKIPKGIKAGQRIRLAGQGAPGMGDAPAGDLYLEIEFNPQSRYHVDGNDVYLDLPVSPWEAALGAKIKVPTPNGLIDLKIPAGSQQGRKLRLKGRGIPSKTPGDFYVTLTIVLPSAQTADAQALYQQMAEKLDFNPRSQLGV